MQALKTRISIYKSNIKVPENRKSNVPKPLLNVATNISKQYPYTNNYTLLQTKEKTLPKNYMHTLTEKSNQ